MTNPSIEDIFDVCVDRLARGQSLDTILADFPQEAARLRPLLEMGQLVAQAQAGRDEIQQAQTHTRTRLGNLLEDLDEKPKRLKPSPWKWVGVAAGFAFTFAFGLLLSLSVPSVGNVFPGIVYNFGQDGLDVTRTSIAGLNTTTVALIMATGDVDLAATATYVMSEATYVAILSLPTGTVPLVMPSTTAIALPMGTSFVSGDVDFAATATYVMSEATSVAMNSIPTDSAPIINLPTNTPSPSGTPLPTNAPPLTATVETLSIIGEQDIQMTATALANLFAPSTPDAPPLGGAVVTSVYGMTPLPTLGLPASGGGGGGDCSASGCVMIEGTAFYPTPATPFPSMESNSLQVQPIQAGEIDDNADWEKYLTYRRNYEAEYSPNSYLGLDVSQRFLITVVDENSKPLFGAKVDIYVKDGNQDTLVASHYTYADGRTQIIGNLPRLLAAQSVHLVIQYHGSEMDMLDFPVNALRNAVVTFGMGGN